MGKEIKGGGTGKDKGFTLQPKLEKEEELRMYTNRKKRGREGKTQKNYHFHSFWGGETREKRKKKGGKARCTSWVYKIERGTGSSSPSAEGKSIPKIFSDREVRGSSDAS